MRNKRNIHLIKTYGKAIKVPENIRLQNQSHSTADEVVIQVKDGEKWLDIWKDRIWFGDYIFNDQNDYWFFDLKKGYEFLQPVIDKIFKDLAAMEVACIELAKQRAAEKEQEKAENEEAQRLRIMSQFVTDSQ